MDEETKQVILAVVATLQKVKMESTIENMTAILGSIQALQKLITKEGSPDG